MTDVTVPFLLAHLSDLHLPPPEGATGVWPLKRALSRLSWGLNRHRRHLRVAVEAVATDIRRAAPDHVAVTGDLTNFGLAEEYKAAAEWLAALAPDGAETLTAIPGNHDAMVRGAVEAGFGGAVSPYASDDGGARNWPILRKRGPLALIGVSTGVPSPPFRATGRVGEAQLQRLGALLAETRGLCRVVLVHHPPDDSAPVRKALTDRAALRTVLAREGAELVLHGHLHKPGLTGLPGPEGRAIPTVGVASASMAARRHHPAAWSLIRVSGNPGAWRIELEARQLQPDGAMATVARLVL